MNGLRYSPLHVTEFCGEMQGKFKVGLARLTSRLREKTNAVYYFQISLFVPEIFKFSKYANQLSDDVIHSTRFPLNMRKRDISASLYQKCLILCSRILLNVLHNTSLTVLLPWQHTGSTNESARSRSVIL